MEIRDHVIKANLVLEIAKNGKKVIFPDIMKIKEILLEELEKE